MKIPAPISASPSSHRMEVNRTPANARLAASSPLDGGLARRRQRPRACSDQRQRLLRILDEVMVLVEDDVPTSCCDEDEGCDECLEGHPQAGFDRRNRTHEDHEQG